MEHDITQVTEYVQNLYNQVSKIEGFLHIARCNGKSQMTMKQLGVVSEELPEEESLDEKYWDWKKKFQKENASSVRIANGATRCVIWDDDDPRYVIKVQHTDDGGLDYNKNEYVLYRLACERGVEHCFAWCDYATIKDENGEDLRLFVMEYHFMDNQALSDQVYDKYIRDSLDDYGVERWDELDEEDKDNIESYWDEDEECGHDGMVAYVQTVYNRATARDFADFVEDYHLTDLHSGNWAVDEDGWLVLVDYGGYCEPINVDAKTIAMMEENI